MGFRLLRRIRRVDVQVSIITAAIVILSCLTIFLLHYGMTYRDMIGSLTERVGSIYSFLETSLEKECFRDLRTRDDMKTELYQRNRTLFAEVRQATGVRYLYTATQNEAGEFIYLIDGLPLDAVDFRCPGDTIEPEIIPELERALGNESVMPSDIKNTEWGKIFISYLPIHGDDGQVVGVVGVEFEAEHQYNTYRTLRIATPLVILATCLVAVLVAICQFRRISNPTYRDTYNIDHLTQLKNRNAWSVDMKNMDVPGIRERIGLLMLDLNGLKVVNDVMGHSYGDLYLRETGLALQEAVEGKEIPYRIGGDEFAILVPQATHQRLEALEKFLSAYFAHHLVDWTIKPSFSVGWAEFAPLEDKSLQDTYDRADARMYEKKRAYHRSRDGAAPSDVK